MDAVVARIMADLQSLREAAERQSTRIDALETLYEQQKKKREDIYEKIKDLENFLVYYEHYTAAGKHLPNHGYRRPVMKGGEPNKRPGLRPQSRAGEIEKVAIRAIQRAERPLSIGELLSAINNAGFEIHGARPRTNLASILSRSQKIYYDHPDGWKFASDYNPEIDVHLKNTK